MTNRHNKIGHKRGTDPGTNRSPDNDIVDTSHESKVGGAHGASTSHESENEEVHGASTPHESESEEVHGASTPHESKSDGLHGSNKSHEIAGGDASMNGDNTHKAKVRGEDAETGQNDAANLPPRDLRRQLFVTFMQIGGLTLGGGMSMVPMMEREIIDRHGWLTKQEFIDILAVSQATPGIFAIDMASHIGYKLGGIRCGIWAAFGIVFPSLVIILAIAIFFRTFKDNPWVEACFRGIRPAVVAMLAAPVFSMARAAQITRRNLWIPVVSCLLIWAFGVSPVWIILAAGLGGYLYGRWRSPKVHRDEGQ